MSHLAPVPMFELVTWQPVLANPDFPDDYWLFQMATIHFTGIFETEDLYEDRRLFHSKPQSLQDLQGFGTCERTGFNAPKSSFVTVNGRKVIDVYAENQRSWRKR